jgi:hypothetical protein
MSSTAPPSGALLPVEPAQPIPADALKAVAARRGGSLNPYQISSAGFDVAFITPVMTFAVQQRAQEMDQQGARTTGADAPRINPLTEFGSWFDYVADVPPVLLVRVTPRLVEGFWTRVGRVAAMTQGAALPPFKRFSPGFLRMRAFCGDAEVTPIHPFRLEQRISESDAIYEGLYVFDPGALAPSCGSVKLVLYSEKEPQKADTQTVDPKVIQLISQDFAALRP